MKRLKSLINRLKPGKKPIYIVSGLPRSGTSMMMKMLEAGGMVPLIDNIRIPDEDNPKGYYEFEPVKKLAEDGAWLGGARGKVVKIISMILFDLPSEFEYKIIFMERRMDEILASQAAMLKRRGQSGGDVSDQELSAKFDVHLKKIKSWLDRQGNIDVAYVNYNGLLEHPRENIPRINALAGHTLDEARMAAVIEPGLYRQRKK